MDQRGFSDTEWQSETLDSDTSDEDRDRYGSFSIFSQPKNMEDYNWEVRTYFTEKEHFTDAIRTYGVHSGRKLKIFRNDKRRICVKCLGVKGKCKGYAYCAYKAAQSTWQLRKIINKHTCSREFNVRLMTSKWLSGRLEKTLRDNPGVKLTALKHKIGRKWNEGNPIFKRLYICLKAYKDYFVSSRPIIGVDGCFLKGKYGGELLTAVGRDGNDQMLPLAYAVVEVENKET